MDIAIHTSAKDWCHSQKSARRARALATRRADFHTRAVQFATGDHDDTLRTVQLTLPNRLLKAATHDGAGFDELARVYCRLARNGVSLITVAYVGISPTHKTFDTRTSTIYRRATWSSGACPRSSTTRASSACRLLGVPSALLYSTCPASWHGRACCPQI